MPSDAANATVASTIDSRPHTMAESPATGPAAPTSRRWSRSSLTTDGRRSCLSYEDAAAIVGVPIGTIRSRVSRSRESLVEAIRAAEAV